MPRPSQFNSVEAIVTVAARIAERQLAGGGGASDPRVLQALHTAAALLAQRAGVLNAPLQKLVALVFQITSSGVAARPQGREERVLP